MADASSASKARFLADLRAEQAQWEALLHAIGEEHMTQPGVAADWSVKDIVAHLTGWRQRTVGRLQAALRHEPAPPPPWPPHLQSDDEINAWIYATNRDRPLADVLRESREVFQQLVGTLEAFPEVELLDMTRFPWLEGEPLTAAAFFAHFHEEHEPDMRAWLARVTPSIGVVEAGRTGRREDLMTGKMIEFDTAGTPAPGYLAMPNAPESTAPGVVVLHAWWGLTEPFRQVCDRLAEAGYVALAPDLYRGRSTTVVEEAKALAGALDDEQDRVRGDIAGAVQYVRQHARRGAPHAAEGPAPLALIGFSLGGAYALDTSVTLAEDIAAVVDFYATYTGPDYDSARAAYLCHFAEDDAWEPAEAVAEMEQVLRAAKRPVTVYTYPGTTHWFFEANRADAYNPAAAALAWERTLAFLNTALRRP